MPFRQTAVLVRAARKRSPRHGSSRLPGRRGAVGGSRRPRRIGIGGPQVGVALKRQLRESEPSLRIQLKELSREAAVRGIVKPIHGVDEAGRVAARAIRAVRRLLWCEH